MATVLGKELKRQVTVEGAEYTVVIGRLSLDWQR
jgi:hypothetical protein